MPDKIIKEAMERGRIADVSVQDEMHTLRRWMLDTENIDKDLMDAILVGKPGPSFEEWLEKSATKLAKDLVADGWPDPAKKLTVGSDGWRTVPTEALDDPEYLQEQLQSGEAIWLGFAYILKHAKEFEPAWFRAQLFKLILEVRHLTGDARDWAVLNLGHTFAVAESRKHFSNVTRGRKTNRGASAGGKVRSSGKAAIRNRVLEEMENLVNQDKPVMYAARIAAKRGFGTSAEANKSLWYRRRNTPKKP